MSIKLTKFDMSKIEDDKVVVLIGKRETGKSYLVKDLLYYHQDMPAGTVISGTEGANSFYSKMMPSCFIHGEYHESIIQNYLNRQKKITKAWKQQMDSTGDSSVDPRGFLILDDCLYDQSWVKSKDVRSLFMNGRHYKSMFIITMQYALGIPPNLRTNVDFVLLGKDLNKQSIKGEKVPHLPRQLPQSLNGCLHGHPTKHAQKFRRFQLRALKTICSVSTSFVLACQ